MRQYHDLLRHILDNGRPKKSRAKLQSTQQTVGTTQVFGHQVRFDLADGFPILTTKRVSFHSVLHELIWFLRGSTNIKYLVDNKVSIWNEWADKDGELGPVYGKQWRSWACPDGRIVDQVEQLIANIKTVRDDPEASVGRRLILQAWNPADTQKMALPPCHCFSQFDVTNGKLSCQMYQRSADAFLGVPFNIASYALLTEILAKLTGLVPGEFVHAFGDLHVYDNHREQVAEQLSRIPLPLPKLQISDKFNSLANLDASHVVLVGYESHPPIRGEVAV